MSLLDSRRLSSVPDAIVAVVAFLHAGEELARWPLRAPAPVGLDTVDRLARLQLAARRAGGRIEVREATLVFGQLLSLVGLLGEVGGQPEGREQVGVEEVVLPGDPSVDDVEHLEGEGGVPTFRVDAVRPEGGGAVGPRGQES